MSEDSNAQLTVKDKSVLKGQSQRQAEVSNKQANETEQGL